MAWQVICISNPTQLSVKDNQLVAKQEQTISLPIEDMDALIIDGYGVVMTANVITALSSRGTTTIICDEKHLPASVILPFSQHSRQAKVTRQQLAMSKPQQKQLWQKIIIQKIINQASVLKKFGYQNSELLRLAESVKSGDSTNRESVAARLYFSYILEDANRRKPMWQNSALNYGYAMVRSHIARHIAARGLITSQGIFHRNELNSFNLADDIIEPYRPLIDAFILINITPHHIGSIDINLTKEDRQNIIDILNHYVIINNKRFTIKHAVERTVESFVLSTETKNETQLLLPSLISN